MAPHPNHFATAANPNWPRHEAAHRGRDSGRYRCSRNGPAEVRQADGAGSGPNPINKPGSTCYNTSLPGGRNAGIPCAVVAPMRKIRLKSTPASRLSEHFERELNDSQRAAVTAPDGYNLILAGPGSGKTRVITYPRRLSDRHAASRRNRSCWSRSPDVPPARWSGGWRPLIGEQASQVWAGTFHHIGNRLLRRAAGLLGYQPNFTILDSEDQLDLIRLAMDDAGLSGTGKLAPKPAAVQHLISYCANVNRPLAEVVAERSPSWSQWQPQIEAVAAAYAERKLAANCMDYDDLLLQWGRLDPRVPRRARRAGPDVPPHPDRRDARHQRRPGRAWSRRSRRPGAGNLTGRRRRRPVDLPVPRGRLRQYPQVPRAASRCADLPARHQLPFDAPDRRVHPGLDRPQHRPGFPKDLVSARPDGVPAAGRLHRGRLRGGRVHLPADPRRAATRAWRWARWRSSTATITTASCCRASCWRGESRTRVRSGLRFFEQAHIKDVLAYLRIVLNPRDEASWRRLLLLLPGRRSGQGRRDLPASGTERPSRSRPLETAEAMALLPPKSKGFFAGFVGDLRKLRRDRPGSQPGRGGRRDPQGRLSGDGQAQVRAAREPDRRHRAVRPARRQVRQPPAADRRLAPGRRRLRHGLGRRRRAAARSWCSARSTRPRGSSGRTSSSPGWSRRASRTAAPSTSPAAKTKSGGSSTSAITRAMNELTLTYPLTHAPAAAAGPTVFTTPSRFLTEIDEACVERAEIEQDRNRGR